MKEIREAAGPWFQNVVTRSGYRKMHPGCRGGDGSFRYLAWHGDALLDLVVIEYLLSCNGFAADETQALGQLDERKQRFTSRQALAVVAERLSLKDEIRAHKEQLHFNFYAEAMEALISAVYKHSGDEVVRKFIYDNIIGPIENELADGEHLNVSASFAA